MQDEYTPRNCDDIDLGSPFIPIQFSSKVQSSSQKRRKFRQVSHLWLQPNERIQIKSKRPRPLSQEDKQQGQPTTSFRRQSCYGKIFGEPSKKNSRISILYPITVIQEAARLIELKLKAERDSNQRQSKKRQSMITKKKPQKLSPRNQRGEMVKISNTYFFFSKDNPKQSESILKTLKLEKTEKKDTATQQIDLKQDRIGEIQIISTPSQQKIQHTIQTPTVKIKQGSKDDWEIKYIFGEENQYQRVSPLKRHRGSVILNPISTLSPNTFLVLRGIRRPTQRIVESPQKQPSISRQVSQKLPQEIIPETIEFLPSIETKPINQEIGFLSKQVTKFINSHKASLHWSNDSRQSVHNSISSQNQNNLKKNTKVLQLPKLLSKNQYNFKVCSTERYSSVKHTQQIYNTNLKGQLIRLIKKRQSLYN